MIFIFFLFKSRKKTFESLFDSGPISVVAFHTKKKQTQNNVNNENGAVDQLQNNKYNVDQETH